MAPFEGIIQERWVEIGDYVRAGDPVVELVDIDPLIIAGEVNGKDVTELAIGSMGYATLVDGTELAGTIGYVARSLMKIHGHFEWNWLFPIRGWCEPA